MPATAPMIFSTVQPPRFGCGAECGCGAVPGATPASGRSAPCGGLRVRRVGGGAGGASSHCDRPGAGSTVYRRPVVGSE